MRDKSVKNLLKLFRTYQNLNDRVNAYVSYKQLFLATLLTVVSVLTWVIPSFWLISHLLTIHSALGISIALIITLITTFTYFSLLFLYLRWLCPKIKEVRVRLIIIFDGTLSFIVLGILVLIFLITLTQRSGI